MPSANIHEVKTLNIDDSYHGWSTVARLESGELMLVCSGDRKFHVCPWGKVQLFRSSDDGKTWSEPEILVNGPIDDRDAGIMQTSKGTIIVSWFTSLAWLRRIHVYEMGVIPLSQTPEAMAAFRDARTTMIESGCDPREELGVFVIRSTDGGKTWSERIKAQVSSPHGPCELADGRLMHVGPRIDESFVSFEKGAAFSGMPVSAAVSDDDGQSWQVISEIEMNPDLPGSVHEPHVVQAADGTIIVHLRHHGADRKRDTLQCESTDGGKTWSTPRKLNVGGFPPHLLRLRDGRLVMSFGFRDGPYGNRAVVSSDNGKTWSQPMIISNDGASGDLGYPATAELGDGSLLTVWYERLEDNPNAVLRQAHWSLED